MKQDHNGKVGKMCIVSMASIPLIMTLGNSMLIPVLPIYEKKLDISSFQSSMIITSYSVASIFLIPVAGYLSDRFGRKKVILPGLMLAFIGGIIAGFAAWKMENPFMWVIIGRVIQGIGASGAMPIILPLVGDLYKDDDEKTSATLGIIETANTSGKVLSPILGSLIAALIWFLPFFSISVFSLISVLLVLFFIHSPKQDGEPPQFPKFLQKTKEIFVQEWKWLVIIFVLGSFVMFLLFGIQFFLSDYLEKVHHLKGVKKGFVLAIPLFFLCIASFVTGRKIKGNIALMKKITIISLLVMSVSIAIVGFANEQLVWLLLLISLFGLAVGAILPTLDAMITENIEKGERGTITSFYSSARFIGIAAGPPFMSILMKSHFKMSVIIAGVVGLFLLIWVIKGISSKKQAT